MSALDFYAGRQAANFANRRLMVDSENAVDQWQGFSERLQGKLQQAEFEFAKAEAGRIGFAHLFKTVLDELKRVDPTNQLHQKNVQLRILGAKVAEKAAEMGYMYDSSIGSLINKR